MEETPDIPTPPEKSGEKIKCRVCGKWFDPKNTDDLYDHLEHYNGTTLS